MTHKEKAEELVRKYYTFGLNNTAQSFSWYECKQCAKIAVDEIIRAIPDASDDDSPYNHELKFWQEVKHELNKSEDENHKAYSKGYNDGFMKAREIQREQHKFNNEVQGEQVIDEQDGLSPINL